MEIKEYFELRNNLIDKSIDEDGVFSKEDFLKNILPDLVETKLLDSEEYTSSYYNDKLDGNKLRINGYAINETGERLQLFVLNESKTSLKVSEDQLLIKLKEDYQNLFNECIRFVKSSVKRYLSLQDSDPASLLVHKLSSSEFISQIDVVEIFAISPTLTIESRGNSLSAKRMTFPDETFNVSYIKNGTKHSKQLLFDKKLIDLNYLYDISISNGAKYALEVDFTEVFDNRIEVLKAADEKNFESYLCVLPAVGVSNLYKRFSTRLLEKNVRSFLNFRVEANSEMRKTIKTEPEKFIAYNNGLTITATNKDVKEENGKLYLNSLTDFQVVNGGQTTASIYFSMKDGLDVSKINLMAKINVAKDISDENLNELISNISLYSNTQSKVSKVDLKSRNPQMDKIKSISQSISTPQGFKWYFEKSRGEFSTLVKLKGGNKAKIEREYPKYRRLTKVELGKYFTAWGDQPWLVKKGGEKVFRSFIEKISGDGDKLKPAEIDRGFYEKLIAKSILFRELETLHGARNKAIGQLRSAIVPYSISVLFTMFGGSDKKQSKFNLELLWIKQELDDTLKIFMKQLMYLLYDLIKQYATSDDLGENTKKEELWIKIKKSKELKSFINSNDSSKILKKYTSTSLNKRNYKEVDFSELNDILDLMSRGKSFYNDLYRLLSNTEKKIDFKSQTFMTSVDFMFPSKGAPLHLSKHKIKYLKQLLNEVRIKAPEYFNSTGKSEEGIILFNTFQKICKIYNSAITNNEDIISIFEKEAAISKSKGYKFSTYLCTVGNKLAGGVSIDLKDVYNVSKVYEQAMDLKKKQLSLI